MRARVVPVETGSPRRTNALHRITGVVWMLPFPSMVSRWFDDDAPEEHRRFGQDENVVKSKKDVLTLRGTSEQSLVSQNGLPLSFCWFAAQCSPSISRIPDKHGEGLPRP